MREEKLIEDQQDFSSELRQTFKEELISILYTLPENRIGEKTFLLILKASSILIIKPHKERKTTGQCFLKAKAT